MGTERRNRARSDYATLSLSFCILISSSALRSASRSHFLPPLSTLFLPLISSSALRSVSHSDFFLRSPLSFCALILHSLENITFEEKSMVVQAEWYKDWFNSPYYHKLYFERNEQQAQEFINRLIQKIHPATGSRILEVGCGKGRYSKVFARLGLHVTAIDLALDNILEAKKTETDHLHFFQHDMRLPFWINYFDYAFNLFTSFGYFKSERENENAIRTMSLSLKPGAMLVLDYLNVHFAENHLVHKAEREIDGVLYILTKWFDESHFYKKVEIELEDMEEPLVYIERVAKFSLGDFTDMFAFHNLQIQEVYGDYHFSDYDVVKSPRMIMIAKKLTR